MRLLVVLLLLTGCLQEITTPAENPTPSPEAATEDWESLATGLEFRSYNTFLKTVRIDPANYEFRVHYRPDEPLRMEQWEALLPDAAVIINANFFTPENTVLGLLVSDGIVYGQSYNDRGGTFFVLDGQVGIRSNIEQPYQGETYSQAVQAFPMLVYQGQAAYERENDISPSRRTVIGIDAAGRVIIMVTTGFGMGLYPLSQYLPTTDVGLVNAFNLDGGGSSMLYVAANDYRILSFDPVPAVLAVYPR
jgi:exopolysaccharide biosynthesis protein